MNLNNLYTPCLVVEKSKLMTNLNRMRVQAETLGVTLRPHVKTCKSPQVILLGTGGEPCPITVSTLREAEYFAEAGFTDIIYAVSIVPKKLERAKAIMDRGVDLKLILDDANVARAVGEYGIMHDCTFNVMIEIDVDMHRAGLSPDAPEVIEIAKILHEEKGANMAGVLTHAGESYECETKHALIDAAESERANIARAAGNIITAGYPCEIVSCGSTPTATYARDLRDVTELRAGVYVFQDAFQAGRGCSTNNDIALSVLCTVISHKNNQNRIITDAGGMALSKDQSTRGTDFDCGYGIVCDIDGNIIPNLIVTGANQEHGIITTKDGSDFDFAAYPIGTRLRILPNHACMTAAAFDKYNVVDNSRDVTENWQRCSGW